MPRFLLLAFSLLLSVLQPAAAQFDLSNGLGGGNDTTTRATLHAESQAIAPGQPFQVALKLELPSHWHSYYTNSGGVEETLKVNWELPEGFKAGDIRWPVPKVKAVGDSNSHFYEGAPIHLIEITPPADLKPGQKVTLKLKADWQICSDTGCIPQDAKLSLTLDTAEKPIPNEKEAGLFKQAHTQQPATSSAWSFRFEATPEAIQLHLIPAEGAAADLASADVEFIPASKFVKFTPGSKISKVGNEWVLPLSRQSVDPIGEKIPQGKSISGILKAKSPLDTKLGANAILVPETPFNKPATPPLPFKSLLLVLGGMLIGGLILNLMPCVFPVLGLKIMGFVHQSGQDRRKVALHGLTFTLGVLLSFWVVSGFLFYLRTQSSTEIGWAYQLQNKWFVYGLMMVFYVFGLSMFGLFEFGSSATSVGGTLQSKDGLMGSFFSGVLATLAATPCSAPILGPAIGAAITLPGPQFFAAFTCMAIGLSLPYLLLSLFPKLLRFLPRPGAWMESFKQGMSFLLIGSAAYFLWVYSDHIVPDSFILVLFGMVILAAAAWVFGRWSAPYREKRSRLLGTLTAALLAAAGLYLATGPYHGITWDKWSQARVESELAHGKPVYVDFTAKWCATCQVNKKTAYTPEVIELFKKHGIVTLRADKTRPDPEIDAKLTELNRTAIPVNVLYVPGKDEPIITPEILTPQILKDLISRELPPKS